METVDILRQLARENKWSCQDDPSLGSSSSLPDVLFTKDYTFQSDFTNNIKKRTARLAISISIEDAGLIKLWRPSARIKLNEEQFSCTSVAPIVQRIIPSDPPGSFPTLNLCEPNSLEKLEDLMEELESNVPMWLSECTDKYKFSAKSKKKKRRKPGKKSRRNR